MPSLRLRPEPASPGRARAFVRRLMADWGVENGLADDAELLVTELVTNAVIHARTGVELEVKRAGNRLDFSVADSSSRPVQLRMPEKDDVTGRGIFLLDQITPDWEVVPVAGGKKVRFSLSLEAARAYSD